MIKAFLIFLNLLFFIFPKGSYSQTHTFIDSLLNKIQSYQISSADGFYDIGQFPSQRIYLKRKNYQKEDNNIFFTGLIAWTLKATRPLLTSVDQYIVDSIINKTYKNHYKYRNKEGGFTYNFWQTIPSQHFPNDSYLSKHKKYQLPDDLDDTSILYLSANIDSTSAVRVKEKMRICSNGINKSIYNTFRRYRKKKAYSTWFGKKMPIDFDICVHTNALRFVLDNNLPLEEIDIETLELIKAIITNNDHLKFPHLVSPHYQKTSIILYHLARLIAVYPSLPFFESIKEKVISDIKNELEKKQHPMEKLLLSTSLSRFGIKTETIAIREEDFNSFYFFIGNMTSTMIFPIKRCFAKSKWTNFYYRSNSYYYCLLLENYVLNVNP